MAENNTDSMGKILEAMWKGELTVKPEPPKTEQDKDCKDAESEMTDEQKRHRQHAALEHLLSGLAFKERED